MQRSVMRLVRSYVPDGVLDEDDVGEIATMILRIVDRSPWYMRRAVRMFFRAHAIGPNPAWTLKKLLTGAGGGRARRAEYWMAKGILTITLVCIHGYPKTLAALGLVEGQPKAPGRDTEPLPAIVETTDIADARHDSLVADVVVIGSGPGGGMAALTLAEAGLSVIVLEAGGRPDGTMRTVPQAMLEKYAWSGALASMSNGMQFVPLLLGETVGGSAHVNMGTSLRPDPSVIASWGLPPDALDAHFAEAERLTGVRAAESDLLGRQNDVMALGCKKLGLPWEVIPRAALNRYGAAACMVGAEAAQKLSPERALLPAAVCAGARVFTRARVSRIAVSESGRVMVFIEGSDRGRIVLARAAVVAAGPVGTPLLLRGSGFRAKAVGRAEFFQLNSNVLGLMDREVDSHVGIEQGIICREWEKTGLTIESVSTPPSLIALYLPGMGDRHWAEMRRFRHFCQVGFIADAVRSPVTIRDFKGAPLLRHVLDRRDADLVRRGFRAASDILFAAGARQTLVPGEKSWCETALDARNRIEDTADDDLHVVSVHLIGTCRMGANEPAAVDLEGRLMGCPSIVVADGSVLPTALGVNPQLTIMAVSRRNALALADRLKR